MNLHLIIENLKSISFKNRDKNIRSKMYYSDIGWAKEMCTIHVNPGRGTGKTTYIRDHADLNDIVIVHNESAKDSFFNEIESGLIVFSVSECNEISKNYIKHKPKTIWLDEVGFSSKEEIISIYLAFADNNVSQTWIRLGE